MMQNIFIDTCVYEKEWFYRGPRIKTLFDYASKGRIRIILPDLTEFEVIKHLEKDCEENNGSNGLHKLENSRLNDLPEGKEYIQKLRKLQFLLEDSVTELFLKELDKALVLRIRIPGNLDFLKIIDAYKNREAPFSEKKKEEFPDAFVLATLVKWCNENKEECTILSVDSDLERFKSEKLHYKEYQGYVQELIEEEESITTHLATDILKEKKFINSISNWIHELLSWEVYYCSALQIEDIDDYAIKNVLVNTEKEDVQLVGYYDDTCVFKLVVKITTEIEVWHPDYDTAYWDSEDHRYYFIDDSVMDNITSELVIPVDILTDMDGSFLEVESINNGERIKERDIVNSMYTNR